jgi:predicted RNA-binding protein YlqC (UPF0109 family)
VRDFVETAARCLVDRPAEVRVHERHTDDVVRLELSVSPEDRGKVIGRKGATVEALRILVRAAAERRGVRAELEVVD